MGKLTDRISDFIKSQQTDKRDTQEQDNFLPLATEFYSQRDDCQFTTDKHHGVTLGDVLDRIFDLHKEEVTGLFVASFKTGIQEGRNIAEPDAIWNFDLCRSMITREDNDNFYNQVTLNAAFTQSGDTGCIFIHLRECGGNEDTRFIRATCIKVAPGFETNAQSIEHEQPKALDFLLAWNLADRQIREEETDKEADRIIEKYTSGKQLDERETAFIACLDPDVKWLYSRGHEAVDHKCYLEAIVYLENAYQILKEQYLTDDLSDEGVSVFAYICYLIGYSYADLGLHEKAFYYLDIIWPIKDITYNIEYINCLVNNKDVRALSVISDELERLSELKDEDVTERINYYCHFLLRRQAQALIDCGELDEAEKQFKKLLQYGEQVEYIKNELKYIESLRKENKRKQ